MRFLIIAVIALAAFASAEWSPEEILLETQAAVNTMKKKGATEADCKDLAKTTCKETVAERKRSQTVILSVSDGSKCHTRGQREVTKALAAYRHNKKTWMAMKVKVTHASNAFVKITSQKFSTLKQGKCGFVFSSRYYLSAKARYDRAVRVEISWKGRVSESHKFYLKWVRIAAGMVKRCHCSVKATAMRIWKSETKKTVLARQDKAYAKCKMMQCVLDGTKISSRKCKGTLKALVRKKLSKATMKVSCSLGKRKGKASIPKGKRKGKAKINPVSGKVCGSKAGPICHGYNLRCFKTSSLAKCKASCKKDKRCNLAEWKSSTKHCCDSAVATKKACKGRWARADGWTGYNICR